MPQVNKHMEDIGKREEKCRMNSNSDRVSNAIKGCLLGTAIGDAIGLPFEGLSRRRIGRAHSVIDRHHFIAGRGMISDDTEHTCIVARSLIASGGDVDESARHMSRQLRLWLLLLPAGAGKATISAVVKLLLGYHHSRSGVFSAGNAPAMRSAIIGVCYGHDADKMQEMVRACARITHTDPRAEFGALAVALAAYFSSVSNGQDCEPQHYCHHLENILPPDAHELLKLIQNSAESVQRGESTETFASSIGCSRGVGGYVYSTVPVALHAWMAHPEDFRSAVGAVVKCGGDTDTTAAIVGGIVGARTGKQGIPFDWLRGLWEWPQSLTWMENLAECLAESVSNNRPMQYRHISVPGLYARNLLFLSIVLMHGFRRMLPPY